jgi:uncharacterized protein YuzE
MKIWYFEGPDTLHIVFKPGRVAETRDLDANILADVDAAGQMLAITIVHAQSHAEMPAFSYERIAA